MTLGDIKNHIYKRTKTNSTTFPAADMLIGVNTARQRVESIVRSFIDNYQTTDWTSTELSTGTVSPIFDTLFHELIALWVEYDYGLDNDSSWLAGVLAKIQIIEAEMKRFYGTRNLKIFTLTIASPGILTLNNHGFIAGQRVLFTTTSALPTGLSQNTWYYVLSTGLGDDTFEVSATKQGTAINTTGSQSGTHYVLTDQGKRLRLRNQLADSNK